MTAPRAAASRRKLPTSVRLRRARGDVLSFRVQHHVRVAEYNTLCVSEAKAKWDFTMCSGAVATGALRAGFGLAVVMAAAIAAVAL